MQGSLLKQIIEGAILAADTPLSVDRIMSLFDEEKREPDDMPSRSDVRDVLAEIEKDCADRGFVLKKVATGYRFQVRSEVGEWVGKLWEERPPRYTRALLETLALIAYKQPITRGDIEEIRGVAVSTNIIRTLLDREWIRVVGQRDVPGKPSLFATTREFLDYFNLNSLDELPTLSEIRDLDTVSQQLDLEEELIPPRTLDVADRKSDEESAHDESAGGGEESTRSGEESARSGEESARSGEESAHSEGSVEDQALAEDQEQATSIDGIDLDEVTDRVNQIQDNIRRLYEQPDEGADDEGADEDIDNEDIDNEEKLDAGAGGESAAESASGSVDNLNQETPDEPDDGQVDAEDGDHDPRG